VALPAFAAVAPCCCAPLLLDAQRRAAIDPYLLLVGHSATNPQRAAAAVDMWDIQKDGLTDRQTRRRTDTRPLQ